MLEWIKAHPAQIALSVAAICSAVAKALPPGKAQEVFAFIGMLARPKPPADSGGGK